MQKMKYWQGLSSWQAKATSTTPPPDETLLNHATTITCSPCGSDAEDEPDVMPPLLENK